MSSKRQSKVSRLIQKELGDIFQKESRTLFRGAFITVTQVRISPDLSVAKVFLSIFAVKDRGEIIDLVNTKKPAVRNLLGRRVRHQLRIIPELVFYLDDSLDYSEKIDNLLKS